MRVDNSFYLLKNLHISIIRECNMIFNPTVDVVLSFVTRDSQKVDHDRPIDRGSIFGRTLRLISMAYVRIRKICSFVI